MKRFTIFVAAAVCAAGAVLTARADEGLLKAIPDDALGLIVVNRAAETSKKIEALGAKLNLPLPAVLPTVKAITGLTAGIDEQGTIAAAAVPQEDANAPPAVVVFVPVTDYAKLIAGLMPEGGQAEIISGRVAGKPVVVAHKGDFALFARPEDEDVLKRVKAATGGITSEVQPLGDWLRENDIAALVLPKGVRLAIDRMQQGIAQAKQNFPPDQEALKPALAMFDLLSRSGETAKKEVTHVGLGIRIDPEQDLLLSTQVAFKSGGEFSAAIADAKWPQVAGLNDLPDDDYVFAYSMAMPPGWMEKVMQAGMEMAKLGSLSPASALSKDQIDKLFKLSANMVQGVKGMAMTMAAPDADDASLFTAANAVVYVNDPDEYLQNYRDAMKSMGELRGQQAGMPLPTATFSEIEVAGEKGFEVKLDMSEAFKGANLPADAGAPLKKFIEMFYGPEGTMTVYLAPADKHTVVMTYSDKAELEDLIKNVKKREPGLGKDEQIVSVDKLLPAGAPWRMYVSVPDFIELANWVLAKAGQQTKLPDFPDGPPLVGGVSFTAKGVEARLALPSKLIDGIGEYIIKVRQMRNQ